MVTATTISNASAATLSGGVATFAEAPGATPNFIFPFVGNNSYTVANINQFQYLMYRPLYFFGNGNQPTVNTALSIANLPTFTNNNTTVTLTLKSYQWSNGETVTAQEVIFWMNMMKVESTQFVGYQPGDIPDDVVSMSTPNSSTVVFNLNGPVNPQWWLYNNLSQITPMPMAWDVMNSTEVAGSEACGTSSWNNVLITHLNGTPVPANAAATSCANVWQYLETEAGYDPTNPAAPNTQIPTYATSPLWQVVDGPWHVTSMDALGNVTLEPNLSYSGPVKPTLSKFVEVPFATNADEFNALSTDQITVGYLPPEDITSTAVSATQPGPNNPALANNYNLSAVSEWGFNYFPYDFNSSGDNGYAGTIFRQLYFRQAMQLLVDQTAYVNNYFKGYAAPTYSPMPPGSNNPFTNSFEQANPYPYNPGAATTLLQQNGWTINPSGTDVCANSALCGVPVGTPLSFNLTYNATDPTNSQMILADIASWNAAGINVIGTATDFNGAFNDFGCGSPSCPWDLSAWGGGWIYAPDVYPSGEYQFQTNASFNPGMYSSPLIDSLVTSTTTTGANLDTYESTVARQLPVIFQPTTALIEEVQNNLQGATPLNPISNITPENWSFSTSPVVTTSISGTVTSGSGAVSGICVNAFSNGSSGDVAWPGATTGTNGSYTIVGLPIGSYSIEFTTGCGAANNYLTQWYSGQATQNTSSLVNVSAGGAPNIDATMVLSGAIAGSVVSGTAPVAQVCVNAYPPNSSTPMGATGLTDANGNYTISALPPGSYTVSADPLCGTTGTASPYAYQTYASTLNIAPGATDSNVNFNLFSTSTLPPAPPPADVATTSFGTPTSVVTTPGNPASLTQSELGATATLAVPANALPAGTTVSLYPVTNAAQLAQSLPTGQSYLASFAVSWQAANGSSPAALAPLSLTITDSSIVPGDVIYGVTSTGLTVLGTATFSGSVTVTFTSDPTFIVATPTEPSVTIASPANGATYVVGQTINAAFTCTPGAGAVLASCTGPVSSGSPVSTATLGVHSFSVTGSDSDGQSTTVSSSYTVVSPSSAVNAQCVGTLPAGAYNNVATSSGCVVTVADDILGNLQVQAGGSLVDHAALIVGNLEATNALWVDIRGGSVGGNLQVTRLSTVPSGTTDGSALNVICGIVVGGNLQVQMSQVGAPIEVGAPDCGQGLEMNGNLQVLNNDGNVVIGSLGVPFAVQGNVLVMNNKGGGSLTNVSAGGNCQLKNNGPNGIVGVMNSALGNNSCNQVT